MSASESEEIETEPEEEVEPQEEEMESADSSEEEDVEESDEIYKEADLEFARFIIQMSNKNSQVGTETHFIVIRNQIKCIS